MGGPAPRGGSSTVVQRARFPHQGPLSRPSCQQRAQAYRRRGQKRHDGRLFRDFVFPQHPERGFGFPRTPSPLPPPPPSSSYFPEDRGSSHSSSPTSAVRGLIRFRAPLPPWGTGLPTPRGKRQATTGVLFIRARPKRCFAGVRVSFCFSFWQRGAGE